MAQQVFLSNFLVGGYDMPASLVEKNNTFIVGGNTKVTLGSHELFYLLRFDSSGQWVSPNFTYDFNSYCTKMRKTPDGGFIFSGYVIDVPHFHSIILKVDSLGNQQWTYSNDSVYSFTDIQSTQDGNYIVTGDNSDSVTIHYIKITSNGNQIWHKYYSVSTAFYYPATLIREVSDGYVSCFNDQKLFIFKIDSSGDSVWTKSFDGMGASSILPHMNNIYISGGASPIYNPDSLNTAFVLCLDNLGDSLWTKFFSFNGGDISAANMNLTNNGNLLLCGTGIDTSDVFGYDYAFMMETDVTGNLLWKYFYGISDSAFESGADAINSVDGGYLMTGSWEQSSTYLVKINAPLDISEMSNDRRIIIYPNPATENIFLSTTVNVTHLKVFNFIGEEILSRDCSNSQNEIDVHFFSPGLYFIQLQTQYGLQTLKIIKQ